MSVTAMLAKLKQITREQQAYGTEKLALAGIEYDDGTIQGVNEHIPGGGGESSWIESIPEMHRNIFRGQSLGSSVTAAQLAAIEDGSFEGLYVGDYWTIPVTIDNTPVNINWRIADMNYIVGAVNHLVIVPDTGLYQTWYYTSPSTGYANSLMHTGKATAEAIVAQAFPDIVLTHTEYLTTSGAADYTRDLYECTVEAMNAAMIYGHYGMYQIDGSTDFPSNRIAEGVPITQLALFKLARKFIPAANASSLYGYWISDSYSDDVGIAVGENGGMQTAPRNGNHFHRPYFLIGISEE